MGNIDSGMTHKKFFYVFLAMRCEVKYVCVVSYILDPT